MKIKTHLLVGLLLLSFVQISKAQPKKEVVNISFKAPLFCNNERKSIVYVILSTKEDSFTKVTTIAYFTDGYPNMAYSDWYSAASHKTEDDQLTIELTRLVGVEATNFKPQKSGKLATCIVIPKDKNWNPKLKPKDEGAGFQTEEFTAKCTFPNNNIETCETSPELAKKLYVSSPYDQKKLTYQTEFSVMKWWQ